MGCAFSSSSFFAGQLHAFRPRKDLARLLFSATPLVGALMIAISRLADYRHDVYDVTCGSLLGIFIAYFSYRRYYPSPYSSECDTPYSQSDFAITEGFRRIAVDEEQVMYDNAVGSREIDNSEDSYPMREMTSGRVRDP